MSVAVDTSAPVTVVYFQGDGEASKSELRMQHGTQPSISRFVFPDQETFDLQVAPLGLDTPFSVGGLLGASPLRHFSMTLNYDTTPPALTLSDEIPDSKAELSDECTVERLKDPLQAVDERCQGTFNTPVAGGGQIRIGSGELFELPASRIVLPMCLLPDAFDPTKTRLHGAEIDSGVPVTAVVATGIGASVMTRSAFKRLQSAEPTLTAKTGSTLYLAYGEEAADTVELDRVAVVADETSQLNPCAELSLRRRMLIAALKDTDLSLIADKRVNGASAAVTSTPVRFAIVADDSALIQGLRKELHPEVADIDVVLGGSFLKHFDLLVDYPSSRVILRCNSSAATGLCTVLPWCSESKDTHPRCPGLPD